MKVAIVGRGNVGGGLADLWQKAGHNRDAGYEPVQLGGLDQTRTQERHRLLFAIALDVGPFFYRFAPPEQL